LAIKELAFQLIVFFIAGWADNFVGARLPMKMVHHLVETGKGTQDGENDYYRPQCQDIITNPNCHPK